MFLADLLGLLFCWAIIFVLLCLAILAMRKKHSGEIYVIWYVSSFFFLLFFGLGLVAALRGVGLTEVCGSFEGTCKTIYDYLTNPVSELSLIISSLLLAIGPQLLTYFLSGLSGSAAAPRFVSQVGYVAVWSLVKFFAALGGILAAQFFAEIIVGKQVQYIEYLEWSLVITGAFIVASAHHWLTERIPAAFRRSKRLVRAFSAIHRFFTRYSDQSIEKL